MNPTEQSGSSSLLQTLEKSIDDLRSIITCRICIRPLYQPYTVACGHSFCFSCLRQWFDRDPRKKTCPDCRSEVTREPAPSYLLREITQIFVSRPELVPPGETTDEHRDHQQEEAELVDRNRAVGATTGKGPFGVRFRDAGPQHIPIIRDLEDGVDRCPRCTWELEDGWCESCGYGVDGGYSETGMSDSDQSYYGNELDEDLAAHRILGDEIQMYGAIEGRHIPGGRATSVDSDGVPNDYDDMDINAYHDLARARQRDRHTTADNLEHRHVRDYHGYSSDLGDDEDGEAFPDTEQYSSDGTAGSLNDFVANDPSEGDPPVDSSRGSHYGDGDGTEVATEYHSDYEGEGFSPFNSDHNRHGSTEPDELLNDIQDESMDSIQNDSDGDSEGGSIAPRRLAEASPSDSDDDADILAMHERLQARRRGGLLAMSRSKTNTTGPLRQSSHLYRGTAYNGRSQQAPIEIGSDSDNSVPVPRSRRNRRIVDPESSDENVAASSRHSTSSHSGTLQRPSSQDSSTDIPTTENSRYERGQDPPVIVGSNPMRETIRRNNQAGRHPLSGYPSHPRQTTGSGSSRSAAISSPSGGLLQSSRRASARRGLDSRRLASISDTGRLIALTASTRPVTADSLFSQTSAPNLSHSPSRAHTLRSSESDGPRAAVAAAKAERRRIKEERRRRNRDIASTAS